MPKPSRVVINIGRRGVFGGLFGNPVVETKVSEQYRHHFRKLLRTNPEQIRWLREQLAKGAIMQCPGCGVGSPTCHGRIIEQELEASKPRLLPISVYTDGSASYKSGDGAWAFVAVMGEEKAELFGYEANTTISVMELSGIAKALEWLPFADVPIRIFCDSQYAVNVFNVWAQQWEENNWMAGMGRKPAHHKLIKKAYEQLKRHRERRSVSIAWLPGHRKHPHNERADELAGYARKSKETNWTI